MKKSTKDKLIIVGGLLILGLYLSRNLIRDVFNPTISGKTKSNNESNYASDIIGKWSLDKSRTLFYKEKPGYTPGATVVEVGKYILGE
jgi:hypothetical protein